MGKGRSNRTALPLPELSSCSGWTLRWEGGEAGIPRCGLSLGRSRTCDLVLDHPEVSRQHARISPVAGQPWIIDLGSSNSVLVNGEPVSRRRLSAGDRIWLGPWLLEIAESHGPLPSGLVQAWSSLVSDRAGALRELAGASSCRLAPDGAPSFHWESPSGADEMGPLRRLLVEAASDQRASD